MFRKVTLSLLAAVLVAGTVTAVPASAATKISNGVACSKVNATTTYGGFKYRCAKNTLVKNSKLTWLSFDCMTAIAQYNQAIKAKKDFASSSSEINKLSQDLVARESDLAAATKALDEVRAAAIKLKSELGTASTSVKAKLTLELTEMNLAISKLSSSKTKLSSVVSNLKSQKLLIESTPAQLDESVVSAKTMAGAICYKGL